MGVTIAWQGGGGGETANNQPQNQKPVPDQVEKAGNSLPVNSFEDVSPSTQAS